jgi:hypothetical protein
LLDHDLNLANKLVVYEKTAEKVDLDLYERCSFGLFEQRESINPPDSLVLEVSFVVEKNEGEDLDTVTKFFLV